MTRHADSKCQRHMTDPLHIFSHRHCQSLVMHCLTALSQHLVMSMGKCLHLRCGPVAFASQGSCKNEAKLRILWKPSISLRIHLFVFLLPGTAADFSTSLCRRSPLVTMLSPTSPLTLPPSAQACPTVCGYFSDLLDHSLIAAYSSRCIGKSPAERNPDVKAGIDKLPTSCLHSWRGRMRRQFTFGVLSPLRPSTVKHAGPWTPRQAHVLPWWGRQLSARKCLAVSATLFAGMCVLYLTSALRVG